MAKPIPYTPPPVPGRKDLLAYLQEHTDDKLTGGQQIITLTKDLRAFKKVYRQTKERTCVSYRSAVANLTIPAGARVRFDAREWARAEHDRRSRFIDAYKMRASCAVVDSIEVTRFNAYAPVSGATYSALGPCARAISAHMTSFTYRKGQTVKPLLPFSNDETSGCASGIHFFLNIRHALDY